MSFLAVGVGFVFLEEPKRTRPTEEVEGDTRPRSVSSAMRSPR